MKYLITLLFLFYPLYSAAQEPAETEATSTDIKVVEYQDKPEKAIFAEPIKLKFVLPEAASFDGENTSQKDFEVLSLSQDKQNPESPYQAFRIYLRK